MDRGYLIFILLTINANLMHLKKEQICKILIFIVKARKSGGTTGHSPFLITLLKIIPIKEQ